jgi:rhodanese-related sulfurtransferase
MTVTTTKTHLSPAELQAMLGRGEPLLLLDVRNEEAFRAGRVEGPPAFPPLNVPYFEFLEDPAAAAAKVPPGRRVVVVCNKGNSAAWVAEEVLRPRGYEALVLEGGMQGWGVSGPPDGAS